MRHKYHWHEKLDPSMELPKAFKLSRSRIMYIEYKGDDGLQGGAVIGRVYFSKSGKTLYYKGLRLQSLKGAGFKSNFFDVDNGGYFWVSGPRKDENNRLYGGNRDVHIDEDVREEYEALLAK